MYDYGQILFPETVMQLPLARDECDREHDTHRMRKSLVMKYGARTGWTQSFGARFEQDTETNIQMRNIDTMSYIFGEHGKAPTREDLRNNHFSDFGDSGALIFDSMLNPVALLIGSGGDPKSVTYKDKDSEDSGFLGYVSTLCNVPLVKEVIDMFWDEPLEWILGHDLYEILESEEIEMTIGRLRLCRSSPLVVPEPSRKVMLEMHRMRGHHRTEKGGGSSADKPVITKQPRRSSHV